MKKTLPFLILLFCINASIGQRLEPDSAVRNAVVQQGKQMGALLVKKDFEAFAKYTYPTIVKMMGGEEKMIATLRTVFANMKKEGFSILDVQIGRASNFILFKGELQCVVEQGVEMKTATGKMIMHSSLIGISLDKGIHWYFIDTQGKTVAKLKENLPNLSGDLIIPERQSPTVIED